jgi:hypothetical protein
MPWLTLLIEAGSFAGAFDDADPVFACYYSCSSAIQRRCCKANSPFAIAGAALHVAKMPYLNTPGAVTLVCALALMVGNGRAETPDTVRFTVNYACTTGPHITPMLYGLNVARWDHQMYPTTGTQKLADCDTTAIQRLKDLELGFLKYPGGNDADSYTWNSPDNQPHDMDTDEYLDLQKKVGVPGFFTVNFTQPPALAADWVRYIQASGGGRSLVPMWEVGDEVWGPWAKSHTSGSSYARRFTEFSTAMRAVQPDLQLAANLHLADPDTSWTRDALQGLGDSFNIITTTFFPLAPPNETDEALFKAPDQYRQLFTRLKAFIARSRPGKPLPKFCLVGFNSTSSHPGPQTTEMANAVFMAQMYGALAETGTDMSCWWAFHNEWKPRNGDFGIVTSTPENRPYYTYEVMKLLSRNFLGQLITAERSGGVELYAVKTAAGKVATLLINTNLSPRKVLISAQGGTPGEVLGTMDIVSSDTIPQSPPLRHKLKQSYEPGKAVSLPPYSVAVLK